jgi:threonine dehydrogenase-like Zn-dependent dehydrogenase
MVVVIAQRGCNDPRCEGCRRGRWNYCRRKQIIGFHSDGGFAGRVILEADRLVKLRDGLDQLQGAVVEPLSVVTQAMQRKCAIEPGMDVVVTGCGIIGMMAAELARACGARVAVTGLERDRDVRLRLAEQRGFIPVVVSGERQLHERLAAGIKDRSGRRFGDGYADGAVDVLIECSGAAPVLGSAPLAVKPEGQICVIATYPEEVPFVATALTRGGQVMRGVMGSSRDDFEAAQRVLLQGLFPVEEYAKIYPFRDSLEAFRDSMRAAVAKAVVQVAGE